jgi:hypothetical protein
MGTVAEEDSDSEVRPDAHLDMHDCMGYDKCLTRAAIKGLPRVCANRTKNCYHPIPADMKIWLVGADRCHSSWPEMPDTRRTTKQGNNERAGEVFGPLRIDREAEPVRYNRMWEVTCERCGGTSVRAEGSIRKWSRGQTKPMCKHCGAKD